MATMTALFNNKGGVGKTTFLYHIAYRLADRGRRVLMVDCDSQCNLTSYSMDDRAIDHAWGTAGNSVYRAIEQVARTIGDIRNRAPTPISDNLFLVPGDLMLSGFEDRLGDTWNAAKGGDEAALRAQSAIYRVILQSVAKVDAEFVFVDLGPNLGALNRTVLSGCDHVVVPISPDLFSIRGTENLGQKLEKWRTEWDQSNNSWAGTGFDIPRGRPQFLGYVTQQHNLRNNAAGMTKGWKIFGDRIEQAIQGNIVDRLSSLGQVAAPTNGTYNLGQIPNLYSLIPYSLEARKPIYKCDYHDGLRGEHIYKARDSGALFDPVADVIESL